MTNTKGCMNYFGYLHFRTRVQICVRTFTEILVILLSTFPVTTQLKTCLEERAASGHSNIVLSSKIYKKELAIYHSHFIRKHHNFNSKNVDKT